MKKIIIVVLGLVVLGVNASQYEMSRCSPTHTIAGPVLSILNVNCNQIDFKRKKDEYRVIFTCPYDEGRRRATDVKCKSTGTCQNICEVERWDWDTD